MACGLIVKRRISGNNDGKLEYYKNINQLKNHFGSIWIEVYYTMLNGQKEPNTILKMCHLDEDNINLMGMKTFEPEQEKMLRIINKKFNDLDDTLKSALNNYFSMIDKPPVTAETQRQSVSKGNDNNDNDSGSKGKKRRVMKLFSKKK